MPPHIKSFLTNVVNIEQITGLSYEYTILRYVFAKYVLWLLGTLKKTTTKHN